MQIRRFGDYELLEEIARGGMGVVFKARQLSLNRTVAVKMILAGQLASELDIERFRTEAEAAANLQHPNIVTIHEVGEHEGQHYFSMDYVDGESLDALIEDSRFSIFDFRRTARCVQQIAAAIHYAHTRGVVHRDLKPSNVLIDTQDQPRITDFGLAKRFAPAGVPAEGEKRKSQLTLTGQVVGTPNFSPPEQAGARRDEIGPHSDVYSLGALLYFVLTHRAPFTAETLEGTLLQVLRSDPVPPRLVNPKVPAELEIICLKCLEKEPRARYRTAHELAQDIGRWLDGLPILARQATPWERASKWVRRHPVIAGLSAAVVLSVLLGLSGVTWQWQRAEGQRLQSEAANIGLRLQSAEDHLLNDNAHLALATLARLLREYPANRTAAERLVNTLNQRTFFLPRTANPEAGILKPESDILGVGSTTLQWLAEKRPITVSNAHQQVIRSVQWSPQRDRVISASADSTAKIWDARTGALQLTLKHAGGVYDAQFSPDGTRIVTASRDKTARVWDASDGLPVGEAMRHLNTVNTARFSADGLRVITASDDGTARIWDAATGHAISEPARMGHPVEEAYFNPADDRRVTIVVDSSGSLRTNTFLINPGMHFVQASAEEVAALAKTSNAAAEWQSKLGSHHAPLITFAELAADGTRVATASINRSARIWDTRTLRPLTVPLQHDAVVNCARFSPDGLRLVTSTATRKVRVWDAATGQPLTDWISSSERVAGVGFSPDGNWIASTAGWKCHISNFGLRKKVPSWLPDLAEAVGGIRFSRDNTPEAVPATRLFEVIAVLRTMAHTDRLAQEVNGFVADE